MYNDKLVYKVVIWVFFGISLWKEKEVLITVYLWVYSLCIYELFCTLRILPNIIQLWIYNNVNIVFYGSEPTILTEAKPRSILLAQTHKKQYPLIP